MGVKKAKCNKKLIKKQSKAPMKNRILEEKISLLCGRTNAQVNQTKCVLLHILLCGVDVIFTYFNSVYSLVVAFDMQTPSSI